MSGVSENKIGIGIGSNGGDKPQQQIAIQKSGTTTFPINLASGKLTHVKSTTIDSLKVAPIVQQQSANISGVQQQTATATFRINASGQPTITTGGQQPHVRVVMPTGALMPQAMIKQIDNTTGGIRTQITAIPAARTISQTSITVTRPVTPTTYIPRAGVTATNIQTQRLQAPIRTPTPPTVTGLSAGSFVRGTAVARNSSSPATTVISPTNATWMAAAGGTGQVQLIRAINQPRQRLITQNIASSVAGGTTAGTTTGVVAVGQTNIGVNQNQIVTNQNSQQTFVATLATVLPPRQQTATLVYSNVSNSQGQQYTPTGGTTTQRFTVAAASLAGAGNNQRRPIQLGNRTFSTAKLGVGGMNTTSISIRAPNMPVLAPAINSNVISGGNLTGGTIQARATTGNVNLGTNSLTTTRIIQLQQQQPGTGGQQIIGSTGRLTSNLMLQPIIMNTGGGKIGIRPTTTVTSKVQPSLTITQLGLGKLTPNQQQQATITNLQGATISQQQQSTLNTSSGVVVSASGNIVQSQQQQQSSPITQIVSVNQQNISGTTGQIITTQNVTSSVGGGTTVLPLAIQSSKIGGTNVFTGTITPIKSTGTTISTPITKVIQQQNQQHQTISVSASGQQQQQITEIITSTQSGQQHHQPTNVFIHTRPQTTVVGGNNIVTGNSGNTTTTVIPVSSGTFLPAGGGTFYYESVPANSVTVSTGVLSLTTTTVTSSVSQSQTVSTTTNLPSGIVTTIPYSPGTFTVVPSVGSNSVGGISNLNSNNIVSNRTIGQIQIPVSSTVNTGNVGAVNVSQIQTVPIRFNPHHISTANNSGNDQTVPVTAQLTSGNTILQQNTGQQIQSQQISQSTQQQSHHHQIINMTGGNQQSLGVGVSGGSTIVQTTNQQMGNIGGGGTAMLIPVQTSIKLTGGNNVATVSSSPSRGITNLGSINTAFLRKRDNDGSPIRAAKNLQPTLMAMSSGNNCNINSGISTANNSGTSSSTVVTLSGPTISSLTNKIITSVITEQQQQKQQQQQQQQITLCKERPISPGSSGGSTTVSANSSPGVDQQINEELTPINRMTESHFNPINDLYPYHQNQISSAVAMRRQQQQQLQQQQHDHASNGTIECTPRKKSRRSTNDSQNSSASHHHQQNSNQQQIPHSNNQQNNITSSSVTAANLNNINNSQDNNNQKVNNNVVNNKENAKPTTDFILKKPRTCNLLDSYKQNWKSANNHFQRHSDVKPREERRPTVMDLANQAHVAQRINGWKIHHLSAQMEDLSEIEAQVYDKLGDMLKKIELHGKQHSDIDRVSDLIKGNMQRSKIISDGVNDARGQILKIFDHKSHVSDIIHRCASKRNFKKREKP